MHEEPWLSVVTVIRDDVEGLARSVDSLSRQDLTGIEFIVIDSSSDAASVESVINRFPGAATYSWVAPEGIYSAMNSGLDRCRGRFVYFLNAGDTLRDESVLATVRGRIDKPQVTWAFGPVEVVGLGGNSTVTPAWNYREEKRLCFARGLFPPHQGTFVRSTILKALGGFDTDYWIVADYASCLKLSQLSDPVILGITVARFTEGGLSTLRWKASIREFHRARRSILQPRGMLSWRERFETVSQFARLWLVRDVLRRGR